MAAAATSGPTPAYDALVAHHARLHHLGHLQAIASWDRMTHMPAGGAKARAAAQAALAAVMKQMQGDAAVAANLHAATAEALSPDAAANLALMQRQHRIDHALPSALVERQTLATGAAMQAWQAARESDDFATFAAAWQPVIDNVREEAARLADALGVSAADALLERWEPGLRSTRMQTLFGEVEAALPPLLHAALERQAVEPPPVEPAGPFPAAAQKALCERVMALLGFDFAAGRLDTTAHPFTGGVPEDVRLATRFDEAALLPALIGTVHETGHARYQQHLPREWLGQPLAGPHSAALHEGQALAFERQLLPEPAFVALLAPLLQEAFGAQPAFEPANLVRLLQRVKPGRVRVAADELTYPLHVLLRVELEGLLVAGELDAADVPAWWAERLPRLLHVEPSARFAEGPLQDPHWASGMFGYFPAYLLGAMVAAQNVEALRRDVPALDGRIAAGDVRVVGDWLEQHVWRHGARRPLDETMVVATGQPLQSSALVAHLQRRHGRAR